MKIDGKPNVAGAGPAAGLSSEDMAIKIEDVIYKKDLGSWKGVPLREAPCVDHLKPMVLDKTYAFILEDHTQIDYPERTAFVDQEANQFFLKVTGSTGDLGADPTFWFGPFGIDS